MMTTLTHVRESQTGSGSESVTAPSTAATAAQYALGALRIIIGWTFLWAFFDKLLALGFSTGRDAETGVVDRFGDAAWIHGGNPTLGYLGFGADGPFEGFYHSIAGDTWTNWAFMFGLLAIGVALTFGVFNRLGTIAGVWMYVMMYTVALPPGTNPIVDDHILGVAAVLVLGLLGASRYLGLGQWWEKLNIVQKFPILK
jgi:thiosulfate dehydrogenase [quinone] large subunit